MHRQPSTVCAPQVCRSVSAQCPTLGITERLNTIDSQLEATGRESIEADPHAFLTDVAGQENWRYTLLCEASLRDVVFHNDKVLVQGSIWSGWAVAIRLHRHDAARAQRCSTFAASMHQRP